MSFPMSLSCFILVTVLVNSTFSIWSLYFYFFTKIFFICFENVHNYSLLIETLFVIAALKSLSGSYIWIIWHFHILINFSHSNCDSLGSLYVFKFLLYPKHFGYYFVRWSLFNLFSRKSPLFVLVCRLRQRWKFCILLGPMDTTPVKAKVQHVSPYWFLVGGVFQFLAMICWH